MQDFFPKNPYDFFCMRCGKVSFSDGKTLCNLPVRRKQEEVFHKEIAQKANTSAELRKDIGQTFPHLYKKKSR